VKKEIVKTITGKCLGLRPGEELLVVCDDKLCELAYDFCKASQSLGIETSYLLIKPLKMHGQEPPAVVSAALNRADAVVLFTSMSLSHTRARKTASHKFGTRIASLPGVNAAMLNRSICIDYLKLHKKAKKLSQVLTKAKKIEVFTKRRIWLSMSVQNRLGFSDDGLYLKNSAFGNLPAGEVCIGPLEGTTNGRLIIDASAPFIGKIKKPIEIIIKNGYAQNVPLSKMKSLVKDYGKKVLSVAELGIGLNPKAKVTGNVLEDEKAIGTAHVALGNNKSFGGRIDCPSHIDFVFFNPTILVDGRKLKI